jgi:hypothetical protein
MVKYQTQETTIKNILQENFSLFFGEKGYFFYYSELCINNSDFFYSINNKPSSSDGEMFKKFAENVVYSRYDMDQMISRLEILLDVLKIEDSLNTMPIMTKYLAQTFQKREYSYLISNLLFNIKDKEWQLSLLDTVNDSVKNGLSFLFRNNEDVLSKIQQNVKALEKSSNLNSAIPENKQDLSILKIIEVIGKAIQEDYQKQRTKNIEENKKTEEERKKTYLSHKTFLLARKQQLQKK